MAKKKAAEVTVAPAEPTPVRPDKITQREAVTKAIDAGKGSPAEGVAYIKEQFDITLSPAAFSTVKSQIKKTASPSAKKPNREAVTAKPSETSAGKGPSGLAIQVEAIKSLVDMLGAEQVVTIARLFEK